MTKFYYDPKHDTNDGTEWTDTDIDDLKADMQAGLERYRAANVWYDPASGRASIPPQTA